MNILEEYWKDLAEERAMNRSVSTTLNPDIPANVKDNILLSQVMWRVILVELTTTKMEPRNTETTTSKFIKSTYSKLFFSEIHSKPFSPQGDSREKKGSQGDSRGILDGNIWQKTEELTGQYWSVLVKTPLMYSAMMSSHKRKALQQIPEKYWKHLAEERRMDRSVLFKTTLLKLRYSAMMSSQKRKALEEIQCWKDLAGEKSSRGDPRGILERFGTREENEVVTSVTKITRDSLKLQENYKRIYNQTAENSFNIT